MDVADVVAIAVSANNDELIEVGPLEPVEVVAEAVPGLITIFSEVLRTATDPISVDSPVEVRGRHGDFGYLVSITDRASTVPEVLLDGLNEILEDPGRWAGESDPSLGVYLVGTLAGRIGVSVRLMAAASGVTAEIVVPEELVVDVAEAWSDHLAIEVVDEPTSTMTDPSGTHDAPSMPSPEIPEAPPQPDIDRLTTESFLESIFAPLARTVFGRGVSTAGADANPSGVAQPLETRVPGENFRDDDSDGPHTVAAESAVDIKLSLVGFEEGRKAASRKPPMRELDEFESPEPPRR